MKVLWGIDLGGTKIEGVVIEIGNSFKILSRKRVPTESGKGYEHILNQIKKLVQMLSKETGLQPQIIGMGTPGILDPATQTLKNSNTTCMNGKPVKQDIEAVVGVPFIMSNDANCFALAETHLGIIADALPGAQVVVGLILGTGVGGGIVINGTVLQGKQGIGGEWGHNFLDESGGRCYCGRIGCVETIISGPALQRFYTSQTGIELKLPEIVERYKQGNDLAATQTMQRLIHFFGKALAVVINILDPDAIIVGGGVGNIDLLYTDGVDAVKQHIFNNAPEVLLLRPKLGDSAGVFGAAMLVA